MLKPVSFECNILPAFVQTHSRNDLGVANTPLALPVVHSDTCVLAPVSTGFPKGFTPMNNKTFACTEGLDDGSGPCSCQDCSPACGPTPVPPPPPTRWTILGHDAMDVIMCISYLAFLLIFLGGVLVAWCYRWVETCTHTHQNI